MKELALLFVFVQLAAMNESIITRQPGVQGVARGLSTRQTNCTLGAAACCCLVGTCACSSACCLGCHGPEAAILKYAGTLSLLAVAPLMEKWQRAREKED